MHNLAAPALLIALSLATAHAQGDSEDAHAELRALIADLDRLGKEGNFKTARERLLAGKELLSTRGLPDALKDELFTVRMRLGYDAARVYATGKDAQFLEGDDQPMMARAVKLMEGIQRGLVSLKAERLREALPRDPVLAPLFATPELRCIRWSMWQTPRSKIWPDAKLSSGDAALDEIFAKVADTPPPPAGNEIAILHEWIEREEQRQLGPGAAWAFRVRRALVSPANQGGWFTRYTLLRDEEAVGKAIEELTAGKESLTGFEALCLVNLSIAKGDLQRAADLLTALRDGPDVFLSDVAHHQAGQLAGTLLATTRQRDPDTTHFLEDLEPFLFGLVEKRPR